MSNYTDAELSEIRLIFEQVNAVMKQLGIPPCNDKSADELIASGEFQAARCFVQSKDMVTPGWLERASSGKPNKP